MKKQFFQRLSDAVETFLDSNKEPQKVEEVVFHPSSAYDSSPFEPSSSTEEWKRKATEYFDLIERILDQRDVWKGMFVEQAAQHQQAQAMLEREIQSVRTMLQRAVYMLNKMRVEKELSPITGLADLKDAPVGMADDYGAKMKTLLTKAPSDVDGKTERDRIAGT